MPIRSTDLHFYGMKQDGTLGSRLTSNVLQNVFANLTGVQNRDGVVNYAVIGVLNNHASLPLTSGKVYFRVPGAGGANLAIALDALGPQNKTGQVWTPGATPGTFSAPSTVGTGLTMATLNPGFVQAIWVRRTAVASAALRPERNTLTVTGTTAA
jgi:hypothetical protein